MYKRDFCSIHAAGHEKNHFEHVSEQSRNKPVRIDSTGFEYRGLAIKHAHVTRASRSRDDVPDVLPNRHSCPQDSGTVFVKVAKKFGLLHIWSPKRYWFCDYWMMVLCHCRSLWSLPAVELEMH